MNEFKLNAMEIMKEIRRKNLLYLRDFFFKFSQF